MYLRDTKSEKRKMIVTGKGRRDEGWLDGSKPSWPRPMVGGSPMARRKWDVQ